MFFSPTDPSFKSKLPDSVGQEKHKFEDDSMIQFPPCLAIKTCLLCPFLAALAQFHFISTSHGSVCKVGTQRQETTR